MANKVTGGGCARLSMVAGAGAVALGLALAPASAQQIEPDADKILHAMSDYLGGLKAFTVDYDADSEVVAIDGQKLQYSASGSLAAERPSKLQVLRKGTFVDVEMVFDGKIVSVLGKKANVYAQFESPGASIDEAVEEIRTATGFDASGADLIAANAYAVLTEDVSSGSYVGTGIVEGVECDHLAFRNPRVDWQVWVQKGEQPLPLKYVITTKWVTGAPQYTLRLRGWNVAPQIDPATFTFKAPEGAKKLTEWQTDAIGEMIEEAAE